MHLPDRLAIDAFTSSLSVRRGKLSALLAPGHDVSRDSFAVDRAGRTVTVTVMNECETYETRLTFAFDALEARLANVAALREHKKKRWDAAAQGFARAVALDPGYDAAARNLASALNLAGRRDEAAQALAPLLKREPVATYVQVAADPELAALLDAPALAAIRSPAPGDARVADDGEVGGHVAWSPARGLLAVARSEGSWGSCAYETSIELLEAATGKVVASLPVVAWTDTKDGCEPPGVRAGARKRVAARAAAVTRVLDDLGFAATEVEAGVLDDVKGTARFPRARLGVALRDGTLRVIRRDEVLAEGTGLRNLEAAYLVPAAGVVVAATSRPGAEGCEGTDPTETSVLPLPALTRGL